MMRNWTLKLTNRANLNEHTINHWTTTAFICYANKCSICPCHSAHSACWTHVVVVCSLFTHLVPQPPPSRMTTPPGSAPLPTTDTAQNHQQPHCHWQPPTTGNDHPWPMPYPLTIATPATSPPNNERHVQNNDHYNHQHDRDKHDSHHFSHPLMTHY